MRPSLLIALLLLGRTAGATPEEQPERSKKEQLLADKATRKDVRAEKPPRDPQPTRAVTLRNLWTHELLPVDPARPPARRLLDGFLRDHYTNQATQMDPRLLSVVLRAAARFEAPLVEIVSAYRAPKYNLMLRKKGHEVARESQHPMGQAVDFRLPGRATRAVYGFVRSLRLGGVGFYPRSAFVHADVGKIRYWRGH